MSNEKICKHPFGVLKRQWGFTFTLMRGKENVMSEVSILMIIYNLKRCLSIMGENDFRDKIRSHYSLFLYYYMSFYHQITCKNNSQYLKVNLLWT